MSHVRYNSSKGGRRENASILMDAKAQQIRESQKDKLIIQSSATENTESVHLMFNEGVGEQEKGKSLERTSNTKSEQTASMCIG